MKSLLLPLSALLLLLAVLLTLQTALSAPAARERLDRRRADLRQLQAAANLRAPVLQRFRDLPADRDFPAALQALADQTLPPGTWTLEYAAPVSLAPFPASMTEATLRIADAPYADLARFLDLLSMRVSASAQCTDQAPEPYTQATADSAMSTATTVPMRNAGRLYTSISGMPMHR